MCTDLTVRSVLMTSVKILPYRLPAQLIRAKYHLDSPVSLELSTVENSVDN